MLHNDLLDNEYISYFKSGFYIDYIIKKFAEIFLKNILVFTFLFFGEKFMIELMSKKVYSFFFLFFKKISFLKVFILNDFFFYIIIFIFYVAVFLNFYFILVI